MKYLALWILSLIAFLGVKTETSPLTAQEKHFYAIVIHGGAGSSPEKLGEVGRSARKVAVARILKLGSDVLADGGTSLDAVETVIRAMEDDPIFNAGRGAVFNSAGGHELDASIMDGGELACGAVAGVSVIKNPISLAR